MLTSPPESGRSSTDSWTCWCWRCWRWSSGSPGCSRCWRRTRTCVWGCRCLVWCRYHTQCPRQSQLFQDWQTQMWPQMQDVLFEPSRCVLQESTPSRCRRRIKKYYLEVWWLVCSRWSDSPHSHCHCLPWLPLKYYFSSPVEIIFMMISSNSFRSHVACSESDTRLSDCPGVVMGKLFTTRM